jgi:hypothetical protein
MKVQDVMPASFLQDPNQSELKFDLTSMSSRELFLLENLIKDLNDIGKKMGIAVIVETDQIMQRLNISWTREGVVKEEAPPVSPSPFTAYVGPHKHFYRVHKTYNEYVIFVCDHCSRTRTERRVWLQKILTGKAKW